MVNRLRRSLLYCPADDVSVMKKTPGTDADAIILELEDAVPEENKDIARENLAEAPDIDFGDKEVCVRINSLGTDRWYDDLVAGLDAGVDTVIVPKVNHAWHLRTVVEMTRQIRDEVPEVIFGIERPPGWVNLEEIIDTAAEYSEITGVFAGHETSIIEDGAIKESLSVRRENINAQLQLYAGAADLDRFSTLDFELEDKELQREYSLTCKDLGIKGQFAIHPTQVGVINDIYTPREEEYEEAKRIVERFEETDKGRFTTESGEFIEAPMVETKRNVIRRYEAAQHNNMN